MYIILLSASVKRRGSSFSEIIDLHKKKVSQHLQEILSTTLTFIHSHYFTVYSIPYLSPSTASFTALLIFHLYSHFFKFSLLFFPHFLFYLFSHFYLLPIFISSFNISSLPFFVFTPSFTTIFLFCASSITFLTFPLFFPHLPTYIYLFIIFLHLLFQPSFSFLSPFLFIFLPVHLCHSFFPYY